MENTNTISAFLSKFGLNNKETCVLLVGLRHGPMHATQFAKECRLTRPNAYDVLKKLEDKGLCHQLGALYGKKFKMASPEDIGLLLDRKKKEYEEMENELNVLLPGLKDERKFYVEYPQIEYFKGIEGIKMMLEDSLHCEEKVILTAASLTNFVSLVGNEFAKYFVKKRIEKGIVGKTLRFRGGDINDPFYKKSKEHNLEIRYAPQGIEINATIFLYDDKIGLVSSEKEKLGILMRSRDYSSTLQSWFYFIWGVSKY
ncbi:MAG: hypothetical protein HY445_03245 [Candidatus Niyogibacteria bacterium]|nr:hypothetical protein [Candidatus Niyogibacteria bacterium]